MTVDREPGVPGDAESDRARDAVRLAGVSHPRSVAEQLADADTAVIPVATGRLIRRSTVGAKKSGAGNLRVGRWSGDVGRSVVAVACGRL